MRARFGEWCRRLQWWAWTWSPGITVDQDGEIDGTGFMIRIEPPRWLLAWARRFIPPPTEEELRWQRQDISDILVASLVPGVKGYGDWLKDGDRFVATVTWAEDQLATDG